MDNGGRLQPVLMRHPPQLSIKTCGGLVGSWGGESAGGCGGGGVGWRVLGGIFALRAHCALLLDYVPPEEPPSTPLGNTLRIR